MIDTTVNIEMSQHIRIQECSDCLGISKSRLVILLVDRVISSNVLSRPVSFSSVSYQPCGSEWKNLHLYLLGSEYERLCDFRKVFKLSVSYIVSLAIDLFLDELVDELLNQNSNGHDNYPFINYLFQIKTENSVVSVHLYWGIPENLDEIL